MSVKSSTELMLYVVLTMPTLNKAYLFIYLLLASTITNKPYTLTELILITRCRQIYDTDAGVSQSQSSL
jgi:hypothetical protein